MGFVDDFLHLDETNYAFRISQFSNIELKTREIQKMRIFLAGSITFGSGLGAIPVTAGLSLILSSYGARRMNVAKRKMDIIQRELARRNIALHTLTTRDKVIAVTAGLISFGVGAAIGIEFSPPVGVEVTNMELSHSVAPGGDVALQPGMYSINDHLNGHI